MTWLDFFLIWKSISFNCVIGKINSLFCVLHPVQHLDISELMNISSFCRNYTLIQVVSISCLYVFVCCSLRIEINPPLGNQSNQEKDDGIICKLLYTTSNKSLGRISLSIPEREITVTVLEKTLWLKNYLIKWFHEFQSLVEQLMVHECWMFSQ